MFEETSPRTSALLAGLFLLVMLCLLIPMGLVIADATADVSPMVETSVAADAASDRVSATAAEFRVDESGAATYSIPLYAAPGTAGVAPKLSLNYSSQGGSGPLGKGWSVGGLSSIARCRATREAGDFIENGVPVDGSPAPVNFSATDRFCLDGQRLIPYSGTSGACPSAGGMAGIGYRTEVESFQRVCAYAVEATGPKFFTVERKDGSTSWYGDRDNNVSANRDDGYVNSTASGKEVSALAWAQTRFQDSTGNYIDFLYIEGDGEHRIDKVRYTGKKVLPGQSGSELSPYAEIGFNYSPFFSTTAYVSGGKTRMTQRLDSITSSVDHDYSGSSDQVRHYKLGYDYGSAATILTSLQECSDSTLVVCANATTFGWSQATILTGNLFETQENTGSIPNGTVAKFEGLKFGDVDGDGRQDLVWMKDGSSGESCATESVYVAFSRMDAGGAPYFTVGSPVMCTPAELAWAPQDFSWFLLDYNGDGRDDIFLRGGAVWVGHPASGDLTQPFVTSTNMLAELSQSIPAGTSKEGEPQLADVNGDGLIDLVYPVGAGLVVRVMERGGTYGFRWGNGRSVVLSDAAGTNFVIQGLYRKNNYQQLNDFNADARSDLLINVDGVCSGGGGGGPGPGPGDPPIQPHVAAATTSSATTSSSTSVCAVPFVIEQFTTGAVTAKRYGAMQFSLNETMSFADINGDGLSDYIQHGQALGIPGFGLNTGVGFVSGGSLGLGVITSQLQVVDANGDGRADVLYPTGDATHFVARYGTASGGFTSVVDLPNVLTGCNDLPCLTSRSYLFGDFDGDGNPDYMRIKWDTNSPVYYSRGGPANRFIPRDVITKVTNGMGAETDIVYAPLTNKDLYRPGTGTRNSAIWGRGSPVQDLLAPMYVVARASSSSPQAGMPDAKATVHYRYAGARMQSGGRGFLGFAAIDTIDVNQSGGYVVTTTSYHQNFPYAGLPSRTIKAAVANQTYTVPACLTAPITDGCFTPAGSGLPSLGGSWFSDSTQFWQADREAGPGFDAAVQQSLFPSTMGTEEKLRDPFTGAQTSRVVTTLSYGSHGNVVGSTVDTFTGSGGALDATVITSNGYSDDPGRWRLGRLTNSTVTHRRPGVADVVRSTSFTYAMGAVGTGLLTEERVQPGGNVRDDQRSVFTLDEYGNRYSAARCSAHPNAGCGAGGYNFRPSSPTEVNRYARTTYDARGRFPIASVEPFLTPGGVSELATQTVEARNVFGDVTQARNLNNALTVAVSGALGRAYYAWAQTSPGAMPGSGGAESLVTYRWCGTGTAQVACPSGAKFRQKSVGTAVPSQWTYFDVLGRPVMKAAETFNVGVVDKDVVASCTEYDATGKPKRTSNPFFLAGTGGSDGPTGVTNACSAGRQWTTTTYDLLGRPTQVVGPDNSQVTSTYNGLTTTTTDPRNNPTVQVRNGKGELIRVVDAIGLTLYNFYDAAGNLTTVRRDSDRGAIDNTFGYDTLGRKVYQNDPDTGATSYEYNALGELTAQVDAAGQRIEHDIDARGRVWRKTVKLSTGVIESQSTFEFDTAAYGRGQVASETITGTYAAWTGQSGTALMFSRSYAYDSMGRMAANTTTVDGVGYAQAVAFDTLGRPWKTQDASGRWAKTEFDPRGQAAAVCDSSAVDAGPACPASADTYHRTLETDAWGHTLKERRGNSAAMEVMREYHPQSGRLQGLCAGSSTTCNLIDEGYAWDAAGNLSTHLKEDRYLETFLYDSLNRLVEGRLAMQDGIAVNQVTQAFSYDALGNICRKTAQPGPLGASFAYTYTGRSGCGMGGNNSPYGGGGTGLSGPHQVSAIDGVYYYYDARGNQTIKDGPGGSEDRTIRYSVDDHAHEIVSGGGQRTRFWYGSDGQRYKREDGSRRTLYLGNVEIVFDGGVTTTKRTIAGVMQQSVVGATVTNRYLFHDQLGSLVKITDSAGAAVQNFDYEAFGNRRDYATPALAGAAPSTRYSDRGFTGHEMVDGLDVIHMNGRLFDPTLGRFLQADPFIQAPGNAQSWNAYTYVFNNPLRYTDPTGMLGVEERQWIAAAVVIVATIFAPTFTTQYAAAYAAAYYGAAGFVSGAISTQSWRGGLMGALTGAITGGLGVELGAGTGFGEWAVRTFAGGVTGSLQGGGFGHAFVSAGLTAAFMPHVGQITNNVGRTLVGAIVGGTVSELTGGKFANGAVTGAIMAAMAGSSAREGAADAESGYSERSDAEAARIAPLATDAANEALGDSIGKAYPTLDSAARVWGKAVRPVATGYNAEIASQFFKVKGGYAFGSATSDGYVTSVDPSFGGSVSGAFYTRGYIHTHPSNSLFSENDLNFAHSLRKEAFGIHQRAYVVLRNGSIHSWSTMSWANRPQMSSWSGYMQDARKVNP